jgi:hypothetical protein
MNIKLLKLHCAYNKHSPVPIGRLAPTNYSVAYCACGIFFCAQLEDTGYPRLVAGLAHPTSASHYGWDEIMAAHPELVGPWHAYQALCAKGKYSYTELERRLARLAGVSVAMLKGHRQPVP